MNSVSPKPEPKRPHSTLRVNQFSSQGLDSSSLVFPSFLRGGLFFLSFLSVAEEQKKGLLSVDERKDLGEKREDKEEEDKEDEWKRGLKRNRSSSSNGP